MLATAPIQRPRALGYVRVSTEEQSAHGHSLTMQPEVIRQWCELRGIELVGVVFDEGVSAAKPMHRRPGGAELLKRLAAGEADVLVVWRIDRLVRDAQEGLNFHRDTLADAGVGLQSITELIDTSTPSGKLCFTLLLGVAEYERDLTRARTLATAQNLRMTGRKYGSTPYGCVSMGGRYDDEQKRVVGQMLYRCPDTWKYRELIVELSKLRKDNGRRWSLQEISDELFARGIAAPAGGKRWVKASVNRVINSHDGLEHLPEMPAGHEAPVSQPAGECVWPA